MTFLALTATFLCAIAYVALNIWLVQYARAKMPPTFYEIRRASKKRLAGFSNRRMHIYSGMQAVGLVIVPLVLRYPHSPSVTGLILVLYLVYASCLIFETVTFIRLRRPRASKGNGRGWLVKVIWIVGTLLLTWIIRGVAKGWVGELFDIEASSLPFTWAFATGLRTLLPLFFFALLLTFLLELLVIAIAISPPLTQVPRTTGNDETDKAAKRIASNRKAAMLLMGMMTFLAMYASLIDAGKLAASPLSEMLLIDVATEFDTDPAAVCKLGEAEEKLAKRKSKDGRPDPGIKAIFSTTSQDKATLVEISDHVFDDVDSRTINTADVKPRKFTKLRTAECHAVAPTPEEAASTAAAASDVAAAKAASATVAASGAAASSVH
jgi:hypothetical protein